MRRGLVLVLLALLASCVKPASTTCSDGRVCPDDRVCDEQHGLCLTKQQASACDHLADGELCEANNRSGRCDLGACLIACGDGVLDEGEQCDDGNFVNHDGCSSACVSETATWTQWQSPWRPRFWQGAAYDSVRSRVVMFGGYDGGFLADTWERVELAGGNSTWVARSPALSPSARHATLVYDENRDVVVMFGGRQFMPFGDTWEYDGTTWVQRSIANPPPPRFFAGMVFDPVRNKVVLFGGATGTGGFGTLLDDTWEYDGTSWTKLTTAGKPSARASFAMAYDPSRQKIVLFGGRLSNGAASNETWELGGLTWTNVSPSTSPAPRAGAAIAYLPGRDRLVLFGGGNPDVPSFADTWELDSANSWTQLTLPDQPEATALHSLVVVPDAPSGSKLVLIDGQSAVGASDRVWEYRFDTAASAWRWTRVLSPVSPSSKTTAPAIAIGDGRIALFGADRALWSFDGSRWTALLSPDNGPSSRANNALAFDVQREKLAMFGGFDGASNKNDTWIFDGMSLQDITMSGGPSPRQGASAVYDPSRAVTVLFGGLDAGGTLNDTWEFDTSWHAKSFTGPVPSTQFIAPMGYDPIDQRVVLLDFPTGDTWAYDGTWTKLSVARLAVPISGAQMVFDPWRRRMVVFGGFDVTLQLNADVLELTESAWEARAITGEGPRPRYAAAFAVHRDSHALVMFGGTDVASFPGDTWLLRYVSHTPDEDCSDGQDNDGDARADAADPDCTLP